MSKRGRKFGDWVIGKCLNRGGNAHVYVAKNSQGVTRAIKVLYKNDPHSYSRFLAEVRAVKENSEIEGILPVLDCSPLPETASDFSPWYVMPLATPATKALKDQDPVEIVKAIIAISGMLVLLHNKGFSHRDIKPDNILKYDDTWCLIDFGLVDFPDKDDLTRSNESVGSKWTIAPEMKRDAHNADGKPADVYSLAKTLWILLTKETKGFEGQYTTGSSSELKKYVPSIYTTPLEGLLYDSTDSDPACRPSMSQFHTRLREWVGVNDDYDQQNRLQWREVQEKLFPTAIPKRAIWENIGDIVAILDFIGSVPQLGHMFCPEGGGIDLESARLTTVENGCIELQTLLTHIVKPRRLLFESFDNDAEWNSFRLECSRLMPSEPYRGRKRISEAEEVVELEGAYIDRWESEHSHEPLPPAARLVIRHTEGSFVIFQKTSAYNRDPGTYDGRHNRMTASEFRAYIQRSIRHIEKQRVAKTKSEESAT